MLPLLFIEFILFGCDFINSIILYIFLLIDCIVSSTIKYYKIISHFNLRHTIHHSTQKCLETTAAFQLFISRLLYFVNPQVSKLKRQSGFWIFHNFVVNDIFQGVKELFPKQKPLFDEYATVNSAGVNKIMFRLHTGDIEQVYIGNELIFMLLLYLACFRY